MIVIHRWWKKARSTLRDACTGFHFCWINGYSGSGPLSFCVSFTHWKQYWPHSVGANSV